VGRPDVLVLDEPTAGLDPEARLVVRRRIEAERERGVAILMTTHELGDAERLADRIAVLVEGRIVAAGTAPELAARVPARLRFGLDAPLDEAGLASLETTLRATVRLIGGAARYEVDRVPATPALIAALATWCSSADRLITDVRASGGTLEDTYLGLVVAAEQSGDGA
jgi:ABC-2 type transport system ATP-binding protein